MKCTHHKNCERKRGVKFTKTHGRIEPICYLAAWNEYGEFMSKEDHTSRDCKVDKIDVASWSAHFGSSLDDMLDKLLWKKLSSTNTCHENIIR